MTEGQAIAAVALGYALQWVKSFKKVPTWAAQLLTVALMVGVYGVFISGPTAGNWREWLVGVVGWGLSALGVASVAGAAGAAPKTDSIH